MYSINTFAGDGSTTLFPISFVAGYMLPEHVYAYVDGAPATVRWSNPTTVRLEPAPPAGSEVVVRRMTPLTPMTILGSQRGTFAGSPMGAATQAMMLIAELLDAEGGGAGAPGTPVLPSPDAGKLLGWGAGGSLINVTPPSTNLPAPALGSFLRWGPAGLVNADLGDTLGASLVGATYPGLGSTTVQGALSAIASQLGSDNFTLVKITASSLSALASTGSLTPGAFYQTTDTRLLYFALDASNTLQLAAGSGGGGGSTPSNKKRVVIIGDSLAAQQNALPRAWPSWLQDSLSAAGAQVEVLNYAVAGLTCRRAMNNTTFGGMTAVQKAVSVSPDVIVVSLGFNDTCMGVDGRSLSEVQSDASAMFNALRAGAPSAVIVYLREIPFDQPHAPGATNLLSRHVMPIHFNRAGGGILAGLWAQEHLDTAVTPAVGAAYVNWVALDNHIRSLGAVDVWSAIDYWRIARLGGCGMDGLHLNEFGSQMAGAYASTFLMASPALAGVWGPLGSHTYSLWSDPALVFTGALDDNSSEWVRKVGDLGSEFVLRSAGLARRACPDTWYLPSKGVLNTSTRTIPYNLTQAWSWWIHGGPANSPLQVSIDAGSWTALSTSTDAIGCTQSFSNGRILPMGTYSLRYRAGNEVFGPVSLTISDSTDSAALSLRLTSNLSVNGFTTVPHTLTIGGGAVGWSGNTATVSAAGWFHVAHTVTGQATSSNSLMACVFVNGSSRVEGNLHSGTSGFLSSTASGVLYLVPGDTVTFVAYSASAITIGPGARGYSCTAGMLRAT